MDTGSGGNQTILPLGLCAALHQASPFTEDRIACRDDFKESRNAVDPVFDLIGLLRILPPRNLHSLLQLAQGDGRQKK